MQGTIIIGSETPANTPLEISDAALDQRLAESNVPDSGDTNSTESLSLYSSPAPHKQQNERLGRQSETEQSLPSQALLQTDVAERIECPEDVSSIGPGFHAVKTEDSKGQVLQTAPEVSQYVSPVDHSSKFKTQFNLVIHTSQDQTNTRVAKVDTAAKVNAISEDVVNELGMIVEPYDGPKVLPLGPPIEPLGKVRLEWHVMKFIKTYKTVFLVFPSNLTKDFDLLLGEDEIARIGFYTVNGNVWFLDTGDEQCIEYMW